MHFFNRITLLSVSLFSTSLLVGQQESEYDQNYQGPRYGGNRTGNHQPIDTDWEFDESWRNNKEAYFKGKTQPQAYRDAHPYGRGGIGIDPDPDYVAMEEWRKQAHPVQGRSPTSTPAGDRQSCQ